MKIIIYADPGQVGLATANAMRNILIKDDPDVDVLVLQGTERRSYMASGQDGEAD